MKSNEIRLMWNVLEFKNIVHSFIFTENYEYLDDRIITLKKQCEDKLHERGFSSSNIELDVFLHLRFEGTDCALMSSSKKGSKEGLPVHGDFVNSFLER